MAEASAKIKISNPNAPLQPFQFENLPTDRNASLWTRIETTYGLSLEELSALQNARCPQGILLLFLNHFCTRLNKLVVFF